MKKSYILSSILVAVFALASVVGAHESPGSTSSPDVRNAVKRQIAPIKTQIKSLGVNVARDNFQDSRLELEQKKKEFEEKVKTERKTLADRIKEKKGDLKERLEKIKDERKKQVVEKIDQSMDQLNDRMVRHFTNVLDKIEGVLKRIGERADKAADRGLDVSAARVALEEAVATISSAREAISIQAGKTYAINVTDEMTLKNKVGVARQLLHKDLSVVKDTVKAAHEAARKAATALAQLSKPSKKTSPSPTTSSVNN